MLSVAVPFWASYKILNIKLATIESIALYHKYRKER